MRPGVPPTVNVISFSGNSTSYEAERVMDPEACRPINGKAECLLCLRLFTGVPERVAVPADATAAGDATVAGQACKVFTHYNGTHDLTFFVITSSGLLLRVEGNQTTSREQNVTQDFTGLVLGKPTIPVPAHCFAD